MKKIPVFTREATGLVRDISPLDALCSGVVTVGLTSIFLFYTYQLAGFPNDNPLMAVVIMTIPFIATAGVWTLLSASFPRSGGDYVFNTRILHPTIGIMTDFLVVSSLPFNYPFYAIATVTMLSDMLMIDGSVMQSQSMKSLASALLVPNTQFALLTILLILVTFWLTGRIKFYFKAQAVLNMIAIAVIAVIVGLLAVTSNAAYQNLFNSFYGVNYNSVIQTAQTQGLSFSGWGLIPSITGTSALIFYLTINWPVFVAGEMKNSQRSLFYSLVVAEVVTIALFLIIGSVAFNTYGVNFSVAASYLANAGKSPIPASSFTIFLELAAPLLSNPLAIAIVFIAIAAGGWFTATMGLVGASRKLFAWSFDRLLPAKFSDVSPRFRTPIFSAIMISVITEIYVILSYYGPGIYAIVSGLGVIYTGIYVGVAALSGILLPMRKELFDRCPPMARKKIGPLPLVSILGAISFVTVVGVLIVGQIIPAVQGGLNPNQAAWTFGLFLAGIPFYYLVKWYREKHDSIDIAMAYKQIPPE